MIRNHHHRALNAYRIAPAIVLGLSAASILQVSAADTPSLSGKNSPGQPLGSAIHTEGVKNMVVQVVPGKDGRNFYHLRYLLTPENCELSIPNEQRPPRYSHSNAYQFAPGGQFEVFIRTSAFPVPVETPDHKPGFMILRMPYTSPDASQADQKIAGKRSLFDRIQRMKTDRKGSVEVIIELDHVQLVAERPLSVKMRGVNVYFRSAFGHYIDYTGPLKQEDRAE